MKEDISCYLVRRELMKFNYSFIALSFLWGAVFVTSLSYSAAITYGNKYALRFGDKVAAYCVCRWLSYIYNLEFYYTPFDNGDQLMGSVTQKHVGDYPDKRKIYINSALEINSKDEDILYIAPYDHATADVEIDWNDKVFVKLIKEEISLIDQSIKQKIEIPLDHYPVAMHVRRGGGADRKLFQEDVVTSIEGWVNEDWDEDSYADKMWPERFPSDIYYIEQLKTFALLHPDKKLYVHIFTDDPVPAKIAQKYMVALSNPLIQFGYRTENNAHNNNVLEDFFAMMDFDALIRAGSYYSGMAGYIGEIGYVVWPRSCEWKGRRLITTEVYLAERRDGKISVRYIDVEN